MMNDNKYTKLSDQIDNCMHVYRDLLTSIQPFYESFDRVAEGETTLAFRQTDIEILLDTYRVAVIQYEKANQLAQAAMSHLNEDEAASIYGFYKEKNV